MAFDDPIIDPADISDETIVTIGGRLIDTGALNVSNSTDKTTLDANGLTHSQKQSDGSWTIASQMGNINSANGDVFSTGSSIMAGDSLYASNGNFDTLRVGGQLLGDIVPNSYWQLIAIGGAGQQPNGRADNSGGQGSDMGIYDIVLPWLGGKWYRVETRHLTYPSGAPSEYAAMLHVGPLSGVNANSPSIQGINVGVASGSTYDMKNITQYFNSTTLQNALGGGYTEGQLFRLLVSFKLNTNQALYTLADTTTLVSINRWMNFASTVNNSWTNPSPPVSQPIPFDTGFIASASAATIGLDPGNGDIIQGYDSWGGAGMRWGLWCFPNLAGMLSGYKSIDGVQIQLTCSHWGQNPGVADICWHGYSSPPGNGNADYQFSQGNWPAGATMTLGAGNSSLPAGQLFQKLADGTYKGFAVKTGSTAWDHYGRFNHTAYIRVWGTK